VVQLVDEDGEILRTYEYDAFGNEKDPDGADTNYFRYCGEYFDIESGTYYLRARYYNPANGRFTQQDAWMYGDINDPLSLNLYTYCLNNPIRYYDPSGHYINTREQIIGDINFLTGDPDWASGYNSEDWERMIKVLMDDSEYFGLSGDERLDSVISVLNSPAPEALFSPVLELINKVERVVNNTDEQKVLNAKYVSWYKGKLVVKLPIDENAASFEVLFIGDKVNNIKTIQHEYGHTKQLDELGILKYSIYVAVPSVTCNLLTRAGKLPYGYYNSPWEYQADVYGGVNGRNYLPWANTVSEMYSTVTKFAPIPHYTH
jgi:RHS repeat-associated protein